MDEIDYHVIATGSTGNAVRIQDILIDCGIPYSKLKDDLYKVDTLLITHTHSDHIKPSTYNKIRKEFPRIYVCGNYDVAYQYDVDKVIGTAEFKRPGGRIIHPFDGVHDVPVTGFLIKRDGLNILYMTDTSKVLLPEDVPLDYTFLESNYDERKIREQAKKYRKRGYDPYESVFRHLSTQRCREFYYVHRRNDESRLIELHQSHRFY